MRVVGITGGIGSGKSFVTKILEEKFGAKVIDTDSIGHELILKAGKAYEKVVEKFGEEILLENREIDRKKLGDIVFREKEKLSELNAIIHPLVEEEVDRRIEEFQKEGLSLVCIETALFIEAGYDKKCDEVWFVRAEEEIRLQRLEEGRGLGKEKAREIFKRQKSEEDFERIANRVIDNSLGEKDTENQIREILNSYQRR